MNVEKGAVTESEVVDAHRPMRKDDGELRITHGVSVGHVVKETEEMISLAVDRFDIEAWPYRQCSSIPKACITRIQRLTVCTGEGTGEAS